MENCGISNRIRLHRARLDITQADLAARVETTPATISRLEKGDVSLSIEWLTRIAAALGVAWTDLVDDPPSHGLEYLGLLGSSGLVMQALPGGESDLGLALPKEDGVAVRIADRIGRYAAGDILIARRFDGPTTALSGQECLAQLDHGPLTIGRLVAASKDRFTIVPPPPAALLEDRAIVWAAPLTMRITPL